MTGLPAGWRRERLADVCQIVSGSTPKTGVTELWGGDIPWVTPDDLSRHVGKTINGGRRFLTKAGYDSCSTRLVPAGSVLYSSRAPIGYAAIAARPVCTNQGFKTAVPGPDLLSDFLYWQLLAVTDDVKARASGTTFREISSKEFGATELVVPPLGEQHRIVAALEDHLSRLDAAGDYLDAAARRLRGAEQALLDELFDAQADVEGWPRHEMATFATRERAITDGPFGSNLTSAHYASSGALVVRLQNIGDGVFKEAAAYIPVEHYNALRVHDVRRGDVVIASLGDELPRAALVPELGVPAIVKADCIRVRPDDDVDPRWLVYACRSRPAKRHAAALVKGVGRQRLGLKGVRSIPVPRLPRHEQERHLDLLEDRLAELARLRLAAEGSQRCASALKRSLLTAAFASQL